MTEHKITNVRVQPKKDKLPGKWVAYCSCGWDTPIVFGEGSLIKHVNAHRNSDTVNASTVSEGASSLSVPQLP